MKKNPIEILIGVGFFTLGGLGFLYCRSLPTLPGGRPGPGLFPSIITGAMCLVGFILTVGLIRKHKTNCATDSSGASSPKTLASILRGVAVLIIIFVYILLVNRIGFLLTMGIINFSLFLVFKVELRKSLFFSFLVSVCIYLIFSKLLLVPLPTLFL